VTLSSILVLGLLLGMRHATDADHVVAVSAIASRERSVKRAVWIGVSWGLGHALTVLLCGGAIILLGLVVPPRLGLGMELSVGLMLIGLGLWNMSGAADDTSETAALRRSPLRSLGVGVVHGLAGSAAVALLVLATIADPHIGLLYLVVFGLGTICGMATLTSAFAVPVAYAAQRFARFHRGVGKAAGLLSLAVGLLIFYRVGFVDGFFTAASPHFAPQ
jgi:high-affinity nickel-transport protein